MRKRWLQTIAEKDILNRTWLSFILSVLITSSSVLKGTQVDDKILGKQKKKRKPQVQGSQHLEMKDLSIFLMMCKLKWGVFMIGAP